MTSLCFLLCFWPKFYILSCSFLLLPQKPQNTPTHIYSYANMMKNLEKSIHLFHLHLLENPLFH